MSNNKKSTIKNTPIVILHGWRKEGKDYQEIQKIFEKEGFTVFAPTMPGSNGVPLTKSIMNTDDYADFVIAFLKKQKISRAIFICHSFGGRVISKLIPRDPTLVEKLVLTGTPLIKQELSLKKKTLIIVSRLFKKIISKYGNDSIRKLFYFMLGEWDYYKAPVNLRNTFKAIVSEDLSPNIPRINIPTLLIWGGKDALVLPKIGKEITRRMPQAKYIEIPNASHKLPYEEPTLFAEKVLEFIS